MSFTFDFTKQQLKEMIPKNAYVDQWFEDFTKANAASAHTVQP